ncbi:BgTH12-01357 [Blumeria graminis f. sp. triticale]|nr:BgTH12-01357 [Blumeria graminis f. sp. triticale]
MDIWETIVSQSSLLGLVIPIDVPAEIRHIVNRAFVAGKASGSGTVINYSELYPTPYTDIQKQVINDTCFLGQGLSIQALQPITHYSPYSETHNSSIPNFPNPDKFDGTRSQFGYFMTQLQLLFRSNPSAFSSDISRILLAGSYLTGPAFMWFKPHVSQNNGDVSFKSFATFIDALRSAFDDPDPYSTAERELNSICQTGSCSTYFAKISSIFSRLGWSEQKCLIHHFRKGLRENIKDALVGMDKPELFAEYAALCISLDNQLYARQREKELEIQKTYTRRENAQSHRFSNIPMPLNSSSPAPASLTRDTNWLDNLKVERAARKAFRWKHGLCAYCGNKGHKIPTCPDILSRPNQSLFSQPSSVESEDPISYHHETISRKNKFYHSAVSLYNKSEIHSFDLGNEKPLTITSVLESSIKALTMLDSGASTSFIDELFVKKNNLI